MPWTMTYRRVRGRAAPLSPKSRPKIPLSAQSALCLPRNPLPAARTVRKWRRFLNGGRVPSNGQAGAAIGCSVSASVFSHRAMRHRRAACLALLSTFPTLNPASTREILVSRKKNGFCAEVVHRGQPYLILENALKQIFVPFGPKKIFVSSNLIFCPSFVCLR